MYGLGAAYSIPESQPIFNSIGSNGRWFLSWTNPNGTHTGGWSNTAINFDPNWVAPPESVWQSLGVHPDFMTKPETLQGNIQAADFNAANPFNPASVGSLATAPTAASATGAPAIVGLRPDGSPGLTIPGTSFDVSGLPWWAWAGAAAGLWFAFGRGK